MLRLSLGRPLAELDLDWDSVFALAVAERCAAVAWHRSANVIRSAAPPPVVARWRTFAVDAQRHGAWQLGRLVDVVRLLESSRISVCTLKGPPLSLRLYGDSTVRASADLDIFVPSSQRREAGVLLDAAGWRVIEGEIPWTQTLSLDGGDSPCFMEVHSSLADLNLLHLRLPAPRAVQTPVDGHLMPVHDDALVPGYLATHAAKHMPVALIYFVDLHVLWQKLGPAGREEAWQAARRARLAKYLRWGLDGAQAVALAADGDRRSLSVLGMNKSGRRGLHAIWRDIMLAATPLDAGRAAAAWLFPPHLRGGILPLAARWIHRLRAPWGDYLRPSRPTSPAGGARRR